MSRLSPSSLRGLIRSSSSRSVSALSDSDDDSQHGRRSPSILSGRPEGLPKRGAPPGQKSANLWTVASDTEFVERDGVLHPVVPGHIQAQLSPEEMRIFKKLGLKPVVGHSSAGTKERKFHVVTATLANGRAFYAKGVRDRAKPAGLDVLIPRAVASQVIYHGTLTSSQARNYLEIQDRAVLPEYELTGELRANCVWGYAKIIKTLLGHTVDHDLHPHTLPQEMVQRVRHIRTRPGER